MVEARVPDETPYNPLDVEHLGESVTDALLGRDAVSLANLAPFNGAGVYAIYYTGAAAPFAPTRAHTRRRSARQGIALLLSCCQGFAHGSLPAHLT